MLEKKGIKKIGFRGQKGSIGRGYGQLAQRIVLTSSSRGSIEGCQKLSLSSNDLLFPVEDRLRSGQGNGNLSSIKCSNC